MAISLKVDSLDSSGQITIHTPTGNPPFVLNSGTNVPLLNASSLGGATFSSPGPIGNVTRSTGAFTTLDTSGASTIHSTMTFTSGTITGIPTPSSNLDVVNKAYVDAAVTGLHVHAASDYATTTTLPAYTYNNGASGVGATITENASGILTLDGTNPAVSQRVLIKDETGGNQPYNGIYTVTTRGDATTSFVLTRATDMDQPSEAAGGDFTFVKAGALNAGSGWTQTTASVAIGTTNMTWIQFSGAATYSAGNGITLTGNQFSLTIPVTVPNGGTGAVTLTGYVKGNGSSPMTASATIPNTDISGLGTMSTQNANSVAITGGTINGTSVGITTPGAGRFTTLIVNGQITDTSSGVLLGTDNRPVTITGIESSPNASVLYGDNNLPSPALLKIVNAATGAAIQLIRYNGTPASPSVILTAQNLGNLAFLGYDGSATTPSFAAQIIGTSTENWSGTSHGTKLVFNTVPNGSTAVTTALTLGQDQSATFTGAVFINYPNANSSLVLDNTQGGTADYGIITLKRNTTIKGYFGISTNDNPAIFDGNGNRRLEASTTGVIVTGTLDSSGQVTAKNTGIITGSVYRPATLTGIEANTNNSVMYGDNSIPQLAVLKVVNVGAAGQVHLIRYSGTTSSPTALTSGLNFGNITSAGYDGSNTIPQTSMQMLVQTTENWSGTAHGCKILFSTTPNGSTVVTTALTIGQDQSLLTGGPLTATGNITATLKSSTFNTVDNDALILNSTNGSAALIGHLRIQRGGSTKGFLGTDTNDNLALLASDGSLRASITTSGVSLSGLVSIDSSLNEGIVLTSSNSSGGSIRFSTGMGNGYIGSSKYILNSGGVLTDLTLGSRSNNKLQFSTNGVSRIDIDGTSGDTTNYNALNVLGVLNAKDNGISSWHEVVSGTPGTDSFLTLRNDAGTKVFSLAPRDISGAGNFDLAFDYYNGSWNRAGYIKRSDGSLNWGTSIFIGGYLQTTLNANSYFGDGVSLVSGAGATDSAVRFDGANLLISQGATEKARIDSSGNVIINRLKATKGNSLVSGDFALSGGWGNTASVGTITGTDQRGQFTVTSNGTGQSANPTITLTFHDGTWTTAPFACVQANGGTGNQSIPTWASTATTLTLTIPITPIAGSTYTFSFIVMG